MSESIKYRFWAGVALGLFTTSAADSTPKGVFLFFLLFAALALWELATNASLVERLEELGVIEE